MFTTMAARQSDAANALIDSLRPGWKQAYVYAEFDDDGDAAVSLGAAFVVDPPPAAPSPRSFPLEASVVVALGELYKAYRDAGHGFGQLELHVVASDHRYRFTFHERADRWPRGERGARLDARAAELLAEAAPRRPEPEPEPAPASPRPPGPPLPLQASTREDLAQIVNASLRASGRAKAAAAAADREGRPIVARWCRAFAFGHGRAAAFVHTVHGLLPPLSALAPPDDIAAGSTLEHLTAARAGEADLAATCAAMRDRSPEHPKLADVFFFIQHARLGALDDLQYAQERVAAGHDLNDTGPLFVCTRCGWTNVADGVPCFACEADRFLAVT